MQRKDKYKEHRTGKVPRLASWREMTQLGKFLLVMVALEGVLSVRIFPIS